MILVLQHRKDRLPAFLTALARHPPVAVAGSGGEERATAGQVLDAMQHLLLYWYMSTCCGVTQQVDKLSFINCHVLLLRRSSKSHLLLMSGKSWQS